MNTHSRPTMPTRRHALRLGAAAVASALIGLTAQPAAAQGWRSKPVTLVKAGTVKLFGVTTAARLKTLPGTPTLAEQGLKGFDVVVWHGIYAPKGTPKEAIERRGAEDGAEGPGCDRQDGRARRGDRARGQADTGRPADLAAAGDRAVRAGDQGRRAVCRLTWPTPAAPSALPLKGASPAARRSRFRSACSMRR